MQTAIDDLPPSLSERGKDLEFPQLHHACLAVDTDIVRALLDAEIGADTYPCTEDENDEPPLVWLARDDFLTVEDKIAVAKVLLEWGADINEGGALGQANETGDDAFAKFLLRNGALEEG